MLAFHGMHFSVKLLQLTAFARICVVCKGKITQVVSQDVILMGFSWTMLAENYEGLQEKGLQSRSATSLLIKNHRCMKVRLHSCTS